MQKNLESNQEKILQGVVISYFGNTVAVQARDGSFYQCYLKRNQLLPVVGDFVEFQLKNSDAGTIVSILERQSLLQKGDAHGKLKPLAANIDFIMIIMAPPPIFSEYLVDRYLVAAELLNIKAILVLNKMDLLDQSENEMVHQRLKTYESLYPVIYSSVISENGLTEIESTLKNKSAVLVGPSGVGKSSIIAALTTDSNIRIGEVSAKGSGKHTTTATRLYYLRHGGQLIDSPGVREFSLWTVCEADILRGFKEILELSSGCKFRDCKHLVEPGCKIQEAVADGKISAARYANYQALMTTAMQQKKY